MVTSTKGPSLKRIVIAMMMFVSISFVFAAVLSDCSAYDESPKGEGEIK